MSGAPVPDDMVLFGEIGLSGEVRNVGQIDQRLKEAAKLGFKRALIPASAKVSTADKDITITRIQHIRDLVPLFTEEK